MLNENAILTPSTEPRSWRIILIKRMGEVKEEDWTNGAPGGYGFLMQDGFCVR